MGHLADGPALPVGVFGAGAVGPWAASGKDRGERSMTSGQGQPEEILTTGEAAALCGVSRSTLRRAVAQGQMKSWHTPGNHLRFTRAACEDFALSLGRVDLVGRAHSDLGPAAARAAESLRDVETARV